MLRILIATVLLAVGPYILCSCARERKGESTVLVKSPEETGERVEGGFSHISKEDGRVILKLEGDSASGQEEITIEKPHVTRYFYDDKKVDSIELEAEKGIWNRKSGRIKADEAKGVVKFGQEIIIRHADLMYYEPQEHTVTLRGHVKVQRGKSILDADEVIIYLSDNDRRIVKVVARGNVSGRIFPEELKADSR